MGITELIQVAEEKHFVTKEILAAAKSENHADIGAGEKERKV